MAINPRGYGKTCTMNMLKASEAGTGWNDDTAEAIKEGFEDSPDFRLVYKNMNYDVTYKTWIYDGNASEKTVGYLHLLSYPYPDVRFDIGDYVQFNYDHTDDTPDKYKFWIIQSLDNKKLYDVHGRILPCNQTLKWKDKDNNIFWYPCYFNTEMTKTGILDSGQGFNVESGALIAILQQNDETNTIYVNQRFILNHRAYVCYQFNRNIDEGLIYVYLRMTAELPEDDLENDFAYNGFELPQDETLNGDVINIETDMTLLQGDSVDVNVYNYLSGYQTDNQFSVIASDVPYTYYTLEIIDGNNFILTNKKQYKRHPLKLEFTNLTTLDSFDVYVWLGGAL